MRKALVFMLLASVTAPAFASIDAEDRNDRRGERAQRADRGEDEETAPRRAERPARAERDDSDGRRQASEQRREAFRQQMLERRERRRNDDDNSRPAAVQHSDAPDSVRNWRARERLRTQTPGTIEERSRTGGERLRNVLVQRHAPTVSRVPREGTQPPPRSGADRLFNGTNQWSDSWRSDRRYDWRSHRRRHGSLFNFGFYHDPFGWNYRPFSIGWRMWPSYYSRNHWLRDPWQYRLPYAPPGYRWIRYYDDAILVDTWDGQVVDVIRNFFW